MLTLLLTTFALQSLAAPLTNASRPSVQAQKGTFVGHSQGDIDSFAGIPFAKPPVGQLRLKPPQRIGDPLGTVDLPESAAACPQMNVSQINTDGLPESAADIVKRYSQTSPNPSEDCLTLDIQRPAGLSKDAKLPVIIWIFGGGFEFGSSSIYNGSLLIETSKALKEPVIFVAVNYRLAGWGFLGGKELQKEHSTNLGIRDQRAGLEWVADNIAAFGGDPSKVTIWGESGGAYSVYDQMIVNGGDHRYKGKPLFRAAIMDSGSVARSDPVDAPQSQKVFDEVASAAGCSSASDKLHCLRAAPYDKFAAAVNAQPNFFTETSLADRFPARYDPQDPFFRNSPEQALASSAFAKVPIIIGDQEDEGTLFGLLNRKLKTSADVVDYLHGTFFPSTPKPLVEKLVAAYPEDQAAGSPFRTGSANQLYPQFKRFSALLGDLSFTLTRRVSLESFHRSVPTWTYLATYLYGLPYLGTLHVSDIFPTFYDAPPGHAVGNTIRTYYINFANHLDPNGAGSATWPRWDSAGKNMLNISLDSPQVIKDDFRPLPYEILASNPTAFRI